MKHRRTSRPTTRQTRAMTEIRAASRPPKSEEPK